MARWRLANERTWFCWTGIRISTPYVAENLDVLDVLVSRARAADVETVIVEGNTIFEDREFRTIDAAGVVGAVREELSTPAPEELTHRRDLGSAPGAVPA